MARQVKKGKASVALVKTKERMNGIREVLRILGVPSMQGKKVFLKPNFNTADPTPGSTHTDVLTTLVREIQERGAESVTVGDRCGPGDTRGVMEEKGIFDLARDLEFEVLNFDELKDEGWVHMNPEGCHWRRGFYLARPLVESEYTVATGCIKTHQYGAHFSMSMKLAVGAVHRSQMGELHGSPHMREMIAEINLGYHPQLIVMDGVDVFTDGGPMTGERKSPGVMIAGTDRVALDAVGLAILKEQGANHTIMGRKIFEQDQIRRAVQIGLGVAGPDQIEIVTGDPASEVYAARLRTILRAG